MKKFTEEEMKEILAGCAACPGSPIGGDEEPKDDDDDDNKAKTARFFFGW